MSGYPIFLIAMIFASPAFPNPELEVCDAYREKSAALNCPKENYLNEFGLHYCRKFVEVENEFSPHGKNTFHGIRHCLVNQLKRAEGVTCENVKAIAEQHHVSCYIKSGYCQISLRDSWVVFKHVWWELRDSGFRQVLRNLSDKCDQQKL